MSSELLNQLSSDIGTDESISEEDFQCLLAYFLFLLQLDSSAFHKASNIPFHTSDYVYDMRKIITKKCFLAINPSE